MHAESEPPGQPDGDGGAGPGDGGGVGGGDGPGVGVGGGGVGVGPGVGDGGEGPVGHQMPLQFPVQWALLAAQKPLLLQLPLLHEL